MTIDTLCAMSHPTDPPSTINRPVVGRFLLAPDRVVGRVAEGGSRRRGFYKASLPDLPLVSIVTVSLNSSRTLGQTMASVFAQTYTNVEYIVIDGGSTDGTVDLLHENSERIDYFVSEPDDGLYQAMNKGLALCRGEYVLILNSDDWYTPDCVESLVRAKCQSGRDFVSALAQYVDRDGKDVRVARSMPYDASIRLRNPLRHETMLVSAELYNRFGPYDETYRVIADLAFTLRMFEAGITHFEVPRALMYFRNTGVSSTDLPKLWLERARLLRQQFDFLDQTQIDTLAEHGKLSVGDLTDLLVQYPQRTKFIEALRDFVRDQKVAGAQRWKDFDERLFPAAGTVTKTETHATLPTTHPIRIATFCTLDHGGAGTGSQRRVEALRQRGVDATIHALVVRTHLKHVRQVPTKLPELAAANASAIWKAIYERAVIPARSVPGFRASEMFSLAESAVDFRHLQPTFGDVDVLHLHWVVGMFDYDNAGDLLADKPIVWTLADMNAFTGGCHYSEGCEEYKRECRSCPLLGGQSNLAHESWKRKKAAYSKLHNLHIVCPSKWMADCVAASSLLGDKPVYHIPNAFPIDRFTPTNKIVARIRLGLPLDKKLLLFGAESLTNPRKGGALLRKAIEMLNGQKVSAGVEVVLFGRQSLDLPLPSHSLGHIAGDEQMALTYSAADAFIFPSHEDNAPLTVGESMLCGTPVVAFAVGNVPELVRHRYNGYVARHLSAEDLVQGIHWVLDADAEEAIHRSLRCRIVAAQFHDPGVAVERHLRVYQQAMSHV